MKWRDPRLGRLPSLFSSAVSNHRGKLMDIAAVAGSRIVRQGVLLIAMAVAARILSKELLGVWALINIVIQFGVLLSDAGISTFVIREKELTDRLYATAFYACALLSLGVTVVTAAVTAPVAVLLGYPGYEIYFFAAAASIIPLGLNSFLQAFLRRQHRFGVILVTDAIANGVLLFGIVAMLLAGAELWSFVVPTIIASTIGCLACALVTGIPSFALDRDGLKQVADYSLGLVGFSTVNFWARNADHVLIGRFLGAAPLGIYSLAYRIMMLPLSQINTIAHTVALPYMAPHQDDPARLRKTMRRLLAVIGALTTAPIVLVWLQRYYFVDLFLGPAWDDVGDLLGVMVPLSLFQTFVNPIGLTFQVTGRTRLFFVIGIIQTIALLCSFVIGVWMGSIADVVAAYTTAILIASPVGIVYGMGTIGSTFRDWLWWCTPYFLCLPACWLGHSLLAAESGTGYGVTIDTLLACGFGGIASAVAIRSAWR